MGAAGLSGKENNNHNNNITQHSQTVKEKHIHTVTNVVCLDLFLEHAFAGINLSQLGRAKYP